MGKEHNKTRIQNVDFTSLSDKSQWWFRNRTGVILRWGEIEYNKMLVALVHSLDNLNLLQVNTS